MSVQNGKTLVVLVEKGERQWLVPLEAGPIKIGRSRHNRVCVEDPQMAPRHLEILFKEGAVWAVDQGSPEGFYLNGNLIRESTLNPGDEIGIGEIRISLLIEKGTSPRSEEGKEKLPNPSPRSVLRPILLLAALVTLTLILLRLFFL